MPTSGWGVYTLPADDVTFDVLDQFLDEVRAQRLFTESMTVELKSRRNGTNVAKAVTALANTSGGLVIVGVNEDNPNLEAAPGLTEEQLVGLVSHIDDLITPRVAPEFIPVRLGTADRIAVVIRVEAQPHLWPVVCGGEVRIRNPGQSVAATHDQILDLVRRRDLTVRSTADTVAMAVPSALAPQLHGGDEDSRGDLLVRAATAVYARPRSVPLIFGTAVRARLEDAFTSSAFASVHAPRRLGSRSAQSRTVVTTDEFTSLFVTGHVDRNDTDTGLLHRVSYKVQRTGRQVAMYVEAETRRPQEAAAGRGGRTATARRDEMCLLLTTAIEALTENLVPAVVAEIGGAPTAIDEVTFWVESPPNHDLSAAIDRSGVHVTSPASRSGWSATIAARSTEEATAGLTAALETFYIDLGFEDETHVAARDLRDADLERRMVSRG